MATNLFVHIDFWHTYIHIRGSRDLVKQGDRVILILTDCAKTQVLMSVTKILTTVINVDSLWTFQHGDLLKRTSLYFVEGL